MDNHKQLQQHKRHIIDKMKFEVDMGDIPITKDNNIRWTFAYGWIVLQRRHVAALSLFSVATILYYLAVARGPTPYTSIKGTKDDHIFTEKDTGCLQFSSNRVAYDEIGSRKMFHGDVFVGFDFSADCSCHHGGVHQWHEGECDDYMEDTFWRTCWMHDDLPDCQRLEIVCVDEMIYTCESCTDDDNDI